MFKELGTNLAKFISRGMRSNLPNSLDRTLDYKELILQRKEERERRVWKKEKTGQPKISRPQV